MKGYKHFQETSYGVFYALCNVSKTHWFTQEQSFSYTNH